MSRFDSWLAELQPEMFAEISPELAADRGVANGDWVVISTPRGEIETKALVTSRMKPVFIDGRPVHTVGMPIHWSYSGEVVGASVNDLTAMVLEANTSIHESKSFVCQLRAGRRDGVKPATPRREGARPHDGSPHSRHAGCRAAGREDDECRVNNPAGKWQLATLPQAVDPPSGFWRALLARFVYPFRRGVVPEPRPATGFYTDTTVCIGCKACEVACKQWNQLPADGFRALRQELRQHGRALGHVVAARQVHRAVPDRGVPARDRSRGRGSCERTYPWQGLSLEPMVNRWLMMSDVCKHCVTAPCQQACPTGAIVHTEFENITDSERHLQRLHVLRGCLSVRRHHPQQYRRPFPQMHVVLRPAARRPCAGVREGLPDRVDHVRSH